MDGLCFSFSDETIFWKFPLASNWYLCLWRYLYSFPFLDTEGVVTVKDGRIDPLYKHVFVPAFGPTLSFVGLPQKVIWVNVLLSGALRVECRDTNVVDLYTRAWKIKAAWPNSRDVFFSTEICSVMVYNRSGALDFSLSLILWNPDEVICYQEWNYSFYDTSLIFFPKLEAYQLPLKRLKCR